jgi:hypothetical protein
MKDKKMNSKYMYLYTSIFLQRSAVVEWLQLSIVYNNHYPKLYLRDIGQCASRCNFLNKSTSHVHLGVTFSIKVQVNVHLGVTFSIKVQVVCISV